MLNNANRIIPIKPFRKNQIKEKTIKTNHLILKSIGMKKSILMMATALIFSVASVCAQNQGQQGQQRQRMSPSERSKARVETMTKELSLTPDQQKKVTELFKKNSAERQKAGESRKNMSREEMMKAMTASQEKTNAEMKKILKADQYKKYIENQKKELKDRAGRRGQGMPGQGGQGGQRPQRNNAQ